MPDTTSWQDLARQFRELDAPLGAARLERQWDDDTEEWRVAGKVDLETSRRFRALAAKAGAALPGVTAADAEMSWFRMMWERGGPHAPPVVGLMSMHGRASSGHVSVGRIEHPARVAADLAEQLARGQAGR